MLLELVVCKLLETADRELDSGIVNLGYDKGSLIDFFNKYKISCQSGPGQLGPNFHPISSSKSIPVSKALDLSTKNQPALPQSDKLISGLSSP